THPLIRAAVRILFVLLVVSAVLPSDALAHRARHAHDILNPPVEDPRDIAFDRFVTDFRSIALAQGISSAVYGAAMSGIHRNAQVETLNQEQPEFVRPIWAYLDSATSPLRVSIGQREAS